MSKQIRHLTTQDMAEERIILRYEKYKNKTIFIAGYKFNRNCRLVNYPDFYHNF